MPMPHDKDARPVKPVARKPVSSPVSKSLKKNPKSAPAPVLKPSTGPSLETPKADHAIPLVQQEDVKRASSSQTPKDPMPANHVTAPTSAIKTTPQAVAAQPEVPAASVSKGMKTMNEFTSKFAADAQSRVEDVQNRAQEAFAKSSKIAEDAVAFSKANVEALVESTKIAAKNLEVLREEGQNFVRSSFENHSAALRSLTSVTSPAEFFRLVAENNKKAFDAAVAQTSKNSELLVKMSTENFAPISDRMSVISAQLKSATA